MPKTSITAGQSSGNVNFSTAQKMIHRLLAYNRIKTGLDEGKTRDHESNDEPKIKIRAFTKEELAEKLDISPKELKKIKSLDFYKSIVNKISLPLVSLYCATKFANGGYKSE